MIRWCVCLVIGACVLAGASGVSAAGQAETRWRSSLEAGWRALKAGKYAESNKLLNMALLQAEQFGPRDERLAKSLDCLAWLEYRTGRYEQGLVHARKGLAIRERNAGPVSRELASSLSTVAVLLAAEGKYDEAEPLFKKALRSRKWRWDGSIPRWADC